MAKAPKVTKAKRSAAQVAAAKKFAAAGRASQSQRRTAYEKSHHGKAPPRSKAQTQAALKWAATGRASQQAKRTGKVVPKKTAAAAPAELTLLPGWSLGCNDVQPTCAAAAIANHLLAATGLEMSEYEIAQLHVLAGGDEEGAAIQHALEVLRGTPRLVAGGKARLVHFTPTDEEVIVAGLVVGVALPHARHAVLSHPRGMVSWGRVLPWEGVPGEAWALEWAR